MSVSLILSSLLATSVAYQNPIIIRGNPNANVRAVAVAAAPKGSQVVVSTEDGGVRIMDAKSGQTIRSLTAHLQPAYGLAWSGDGSIIASGDETARIFIESTAGKKAREYRTHTKGIEKLSFSPDSKLLLSTGKDDELKIYQIGNSKPKEISHILGAGANVYGAAFNPITGTTLLTGVLDKGARLYDVRTGALKATYPGHDSQGVLDIAFSPSGGRAVTGGKDGTAIVWDLATGKKVGTLRGHEDWIVSVAFSPNGKIIATGSTDRTLRIWNAYSMTQIGKIDGQSSVGTPLCFTADGSTLVSVSDEGGVEFNKIVPAQGSSVTPAKPAPKKRRRR